MTPSFLEPEVIIETSLNAGNPAGPDLPRKAPRLTLTGMAARTSSRPPAWGRLLVHIIAAIGITVLSLFVVPMFADVSKASGDGKTPHALSAQLMEFHPNGYYLAGGALTGLAVLKALLAKMRGLAILLNIIFIIAFVAWLGLLVAGLYLPIMDGIDRMMTDATP